MRKRSSSKKYKSKIRLNIHELELNVDYIVHMIQGWYHAVYICTVSCILTLICLLYIHDIYMYTNGT